MKLTEAITILDARRHNTCSREEKISWLSALDGMIRTRILDQYEPGKAPFAGYTADTPGDTQLLVAAPYDLLYICWLEANVDYCNGEFTRYNNSIAQFQYAYSLFFEDYHRNHRPLTPAPGFH